MKTAVLFALALTIGCSPAPARPPVPATTGGSGGSSSTDTGGTIGTATGGTVGSGGTTASGGSGGSTVTPDAAPLPVDAASPGVDALMSIDATMSTPAGDGGAGSGNGPGPGVVPLPDKPSVYMCPKDADHTACCQALCECVNRICIDSAKAKPGLANCMSTCDKLSDMLMRCHVYHCYESVSPSGVKDHDSHCGHAANQVNGGGCPTSVYAK